MGISPISVLMYNIKCADQDFVIMLLRGEEDAERIKIYLLYDPGSLDCSQGSDVGEAVLRGDQD